MKIQRVQKMQRIQRVKVGALLEIWERQYDKTHLVSWWAGRYSRRGLPLRGRGAYGPVLTHGPRVVAADAAGTEALVGAIMIKPGSRPGGRGKSGTPFGGCATTFTQREACH